MRASSRSPWLTGEWRVWKKNSKTNNTPPNTQYFVTHTGEQGNFLQDVAKWVKEGKIFVKETHTKGIEQWPVAFQSLFTGTNHGKVVVDLR